ncbi:tRNA N6-adenosine threonylcarbamoyltransferase, mitochondrial-like [Pectinophora gossypiella]|uniref:tRNA N6-adenosine threonylcarbamoyltransferase, mitochondrial-like n=1 Tax=Pectinophora gossypiella TaxID=13191 RepID=UPI00214E5924|nr:tRNA N6-adenosine threonylcarbamoyltransferase, mitochondrial-like [Pectinophora gossypiella]
MLRRNQNKLNYLFVIVLTIAMLSPCRYSLLSQIKIIKCLVRSYGIPAYSKSSKILGIETSCDDTGCAVVDGAGNLLGETLYSQSAIHVRYGGVNPTVAHDLHRENIEAAVTGALKKANFTMNDVDAIAVTTRPGLLISLQVGVMYAKFLSRTHQKPLIPVHHMEAHALVARMYHEIPFPFLALLISGGHCLVSVVKDVNDFLLLGKSLDNAPGEVMDKVARRMKLRNIPEYSQVSGGQAIELAATYAKNPGMFEFPLPLVRSRDCDFSFSGLKDSLVRKLISKEAEHGIIGDGIIPEVNDLCAAFQLAIAEHVVHRLDRAILFCEKNKIITDNCKNIVVSGGVACNNFIFNSLQYLGEKRGYNVYRPPPRVCTDNGIMIAWNGIEKLRIQQGVFSNIDLKDIDPEAPLGKNIIEEVKSANIQTKVTRLKKYIVSYFCALISSLTLKINLKEKYVCNFTTLFY